MLICGLASALSTHLVGLPRSSVTSTLSVLIPSPVSLNGLSGDYCSVYTGADATVLIRAAGYLIVPGPIVVRSSVSTGIVSAPLTGRPAGRTNDLCIIVVILKIAIAC